LLPALNARNCKEERLLIVISFKNKEQLIAVSKLDSSTGREQAQAVWNAIIDWDLEEKVQILCCDTTASNTGRLNGACILLEQKLDRELVIFACRHHVYELVLKSVFEIKISQVTTSPDIPLFKKFRENWKNVDPNMIQGYREKVEMYFTTSEIEALLTFYHGELTKKIVRDDYRELIELSVIFLNGDPDRKLKIRPPGAMHQVRWMARAIYSLKICLLSSQSKLTSKDKASLLDVCIFIVTCYVKPWLQCIIPIKSPNQDMCFLKALKTYENVEINISKAVLHKFSQHLWHLTEEAAILALFDDEVVEATKIKIVENLTNENILAPGKRYISSKDEICGSLYG
jgi:hypothetical protein